MLLQNGRYIAPQGIGTPVIATDVRHRKAGCILHQPVGLRRQSGQIHIAVGILGRNQIHTCRLQHFCAVLGAEIRIHNIQISDADLLALFCQLQCIIHRNIGLAAAVMAGKQGQSFMFHNHNFLRMILPLVVLGRLSLNTTIRGYL